MKTKIKACLTCLLLTLTSSCVVAPRIPELTLPEARQSECPKPPACLKEKVQECSKIDLPPTIGRDIYLSIKGDKIEANKGGKDLVRAYLNARGDIKKTWYAQ